MRARTIAAPLAAAALGLGLAGCGAGGDAEAGGQAEPITIGAVDDSTLQWQAFKDEAEKAGIPVETVNFSDFATPNDALVQGQIDLNQFQHVRYLAAYNVKNTVRLAPVGATQIYPLQLYSKRHRSIDALPQGATIALSDNPANQIRPLLSLKAAGLVTFRDGAGTWQSSLADVDRARSKVTLVTLDPTQIGPALDSLKGVNDLLKEQNQNLQDTITYMAPFYRLYANVLGNGRWFESSVVNLLPPALPQQNTTRPPNKQAMENQAGTGVG